MGASEIIVLGVGALGVVVGALLDARDAGPEPLSFRRGVPSRGWHRSLLRAGSTFAILTVLLQSPLLAAPWSPLLIGAVIAVVFGGGDLLAVAWHNATRIDRMRRGA